MQDCIEALIGDIIDETDVYASVKEHTLRRKNSSRGKLSHEYAGTQLSQSSFIDMFRRKKTHNSLSPQEVTTVYQVLSNEVSAFKQDIISMADAKRLLSTCVIEQMNRNENDGRAETDDGYIFEKGRKCDFFLLMLEGRLEVDAGTESFRVTIGPWKPLAANALTQPNYVSDFNAIVSSPTCRYLKIFEEDYAAAKKGGLSQNSLDRRRESNEALVPAGSTNTSPVLEPMSVEISVRAPDT